MDSSPQPTSRPAGRRRGRPLGVGLLAAAALALTACASGGSADPTGSAGSSPAAAPDTGATSATPDSEAASSSDPASSADPAPGGPVGLSSELPPELTGEPVARLRQVVQLAAGPGAELGEDLVSSSVRREVLLDTAARTEALAGEGEGSAELDARERECVDASRAALETEAASGPAHAQWYAQPRTDSTTGGTGAAASHGAETKTEVPPLGVEVSVFPDETAARAAVDAAHAAAETCTGLVLPVVGVVVVEELTAGPESRGHTVLPGPETSVYAVSTVLQTGDRVFTVSQAEPDGGVPEGAEDRARQIIADLDAALEG